MLIPLILLASVASADGIEVLQAGETFRATEKVFVLPESYYDTCLEKAQLLEDTQAELYQLQDSAVPALEQAQEALSDSQAELQRCGQQVGILRTDASILTTENDQLRVQRAMLGGGIVIIAAVAILEGCALAQR